MSSTTQANTTRCEAICDRPAAYEITLLAGLKQLLCVDHTAKWRADKRVSWMTVSVRSLPVSGNP